MAPGSRFQLNRGAAQHVVVIGAGMGGLAAAMDLARRGYRVTILERHATPGGRMRERNVTGLRIDSGPTVFTLRDVFESLFADAGTSLEAHVSTVRLERLAHHRWPDGSALDLYPDRQASIEAIRQFAGLREADGYAAFAAASERMYATLNAAFMRREKPSPISLGLRVGPGKITDLWATRPFRTLWDELGRYFRDPRLTQLFGRYATYCGSSPLEAPATLMLIAHVESLGVEAIDGGMQRLAEAMATAAAQCGAHIRYCSDVRSIQHARGRVSGVELASGEIVLADSVVFNGDAVALSRGLLGDSLARCIPDRRSEQRSLSAVTWSGSARLADSHLAYHSVLFQNDYPDEFKRLFSERRLPDAPTLYVCAQDRLGRHQTPGSAPDGRERVFVLANAPSVALSDSALADYQACCQSLLRDYGLEISLADCARGDPAEFDHCFPGTDGAIYGWPVHGWQGSFRRHGCRTRLRGLYLAGGSVHPGPGVPMAALSGRIAAAAIAKDSC